MRLFSSKKDAKGWQNDYGKQTPTSVKKLPGEPVFAILDLETTGFDLHKDRILSIALALIHDSTFRPGSMREWVVYQEQAVLNEAVKIHGIMPAESREGKAEDTVLEELIPLLTGTVMVGHHIHFDAAMLNAALRRQFGMKFRNLLLDTAALSMYELDAFKKSGYSNQRPPSLDEVCVQMGINTVDRHTAAGDVFTTAQLFLTLLAKAKNRRGDRFSWKDLPVSKL